MIPTRELWSLLREPLNTLSFAGIKEVAASAGLPTAGLARLTQAKGSQTTKGHLLDALDGLFSQLGAAEQDRVTERAVSELISRKPEVAERLGELLSRKGFELLGDQIVPLELQFHALGVQDEHISRSMEKAIRRYRDGDTAGCITALVGMVDYKAGKIPKEAGKEPVAAQAPLHQKIKSAYDALKPLRQQRFAVLPQPDDAATHEEKAAVAAANLLAALRRQASDAHGETYDTDLVREAARTAIFVLGCLEPGDDGARPTEP